MVPALPSGQQKGQRLSRHRPFNIPQATVDRRLTTPPGNHGANLPSGAAPLANQRAYSVAGIASRVTIRRVWQTTPRRPVTAENACRLGCFAPNDVPVARLNSPTARRDSRPQSPSIDPR
jgi:hypothetical protein